MSTNYRTSPERLATLEGDLERYEDHTRHMLDTLREALTSIERTLERTAYLEAGRAVTDLTSVIKVLTDDLERCARTHESIRTFRSN